MKEVNVTTGYGLITDSDGKAIRNQCAIGTMVIEDSSTYTVLTEAEFNAVPVYNSDTLITWALSQQFAASIMAHMAAFLDFANKATPVSKANFQAYASAVGLSATANTIIAKSVELGAELGE